MDQIRIGIIRIGIMLIRIFTVALCSFCSYIFSDIIEEHPPGSASAYTLTESPHESLANRECEPSTIVDGFVCVITGDFIESQTDLVIQGAEPMALQRHYASAKPLNDTNRHPGWIMNHHGKLFKGMEEDKLHLFFCNEFGSTMHYSHKNYDSGAVNLIYYDSESLKKGVTNCASHEISARKNHKNTCIEAADFNHFTAKDGSGTTYRFGSKLAAGQPSYFHPLLKIEKPNGNQIVYQYDHSQLKSIGVFNSKGESLHSISITYPEKNLVCISTQEGREIQYRSQKNSQGFPIYSVTTNFSMPKMYIYSKKTTNNPSRIIRKQESADRYMEIEYYEKGDSPFSSPESGIASKYDSRVGRVKCLKKPAGSDNTPIITHRFDYDINEKGCPGHKNLLGGTTSLFDAYNRKVSYHYSDEHRLTCFKKYTGTSNPRLYSLEKFYWGDLNSEDDSHLISKTVESPDGRILSCRHLKYDSRGNVLQESWWGNLTGKNPHPIVLNGKGIPQPNDCECYQKNYRYSSDGFNLKTYESDAQHAVVYRYYEGTDLLQKKFIKSKGKICIRHFYEYDGNGALAKEIIDDGSSEDLNALLDVTERRIKTITPRAVLPIGLPEKMEESYQDLASGQIILLQKTIFDYDTQGHIIRQEHYDSQDKLAYSLYWEYDAFGQVIKEINALGQVIEKKYDPNGNKIFEQGPCHDFCTQYHYDYSNRLIKTEKVGCDGKRYANTYTYDYLGNMTGSTDYYGNETSYVYDEFKRLVQTIYPEVLNEDETKKRPISKLEYDLLGNNTLFEDTQGRITTKKYNLRGQPLETLHPDGTLETFEYDLNGNLIKSVSPNGSFALYSYDYQSRLIKTERYSPSGSLLSSTSAAYNAFHLMEEVDAEGAVTSYRYDAAGKLILVKKGKQKQTYHYDSLGRLAELHEYFGYGPLDYIVKKNAFDGLNRIIEERIEDASGKINKRIQYVYDELGRKIESIHSSQEGLAISRTSYDIHGHIIEEIDPLGNKTVHLYQRDYFNLLGQNTPYIQTTDPLGRLRITIKDALGKTVTQILQDPFGERVHQKDLSYSLAGLLVRQIDTLTSPEDSPRQVMTLWQYDSCGRALAFIEAAASADQKITRYTYNELGLQDTLIKPDGTAIFTSYDAENRVKERYSSDQSIHYAYDYNRKGMATSLEDKIHHAATQKKYDACDHLVSETLENGCTIQYQYDRLGRVQKIILPDQSQIAYFYEGIFLSKILRLNSDLKIKYTHHYLEYDLSGLPMVSKMINGCGLIKKTFDLLGRGVNINSPHWQEKMISHDSAGNVLSREFQDSLSRKECHYSYDNQNQLLSEKGESAHDYVYDSLHNRVSKNGLKYNVNNLNQVLSDSNSNYQYDLNGRLIKKESPEGTIKFHYDALDRLISVFQGNQKIHYRYDAENRRMQKTVIKRISKEHWAPASKTYFLYEGLNEIGSLNKEGKFKELRVLGIGYGAEIGAAVALEIEGIAYAPIHDINGNLRTVIEASSGEVVETYRFSAFGEEQIYDKEGQLLNESINPWRFSSKRTEPETGFVYFGHRYYDPAAGRWITPDPIGFEAGPNLYAYVSNNPQGHIDLYGLFEETPWEGKEPESSSLVEKVVHGIGHVIKAIGDHIIPIPYVREVFSYIGHRMAGGSHDSFKNQSRFQGSCSFDFIKDYATPRASIVLVGGILTSKSEWEKEAERLSNTYGNVNVHVVYNSSHGFAFDILECIAQKLGFRTHSVKVLVKSLKERIKALGGPKSGLQLKAIGWSQGGLILDCALKHLTPEEKKMMHIATFGSAQMISAKGLGSSINYVSYKDAVPFIATPTLFFKTLSGKSGNVKFLQAPSFPLIDHVFANPSYSQAMQMEGQRYAFR
jgi:RHS repeat-associated protein